MKGAPAAEATAEFIIVTNGKTGTHRILDPCQTIPPNCEIVLHRVLDIAA